MQVIGENGPAPKNGPPPPPAPPSPKPTVVISQIEQMKVTATVVQHGKIRLGNKRAMSDFKPKPGEVVFDIDRPNILGNPYPIESHLLIHRSESVEKYAKLLAEQMLNHNSSMFKEVAKIAQALREGKDVILMCWCHPLQCHGDVVMEAVLALNSALSNDVMAPMEAPEWLKEQMDRIRSQQPCSFGQAVLQFEASAFWIHERRKFDVWWKQRVESDGILFSQRNAKNQELYRLARMNAHDAWMEGAKAKFQMVEALQYYADPHRPEDYLNDNGDKALTVLKETGYAKDSPKLGPEVEEQ